MFVFIESPENSQERDGRCKYSFNTSRLRHFIRRIKFGLGCRKTVRLCLFLRFTCPVVFQVLEHLIVYFDANEVAVLYGSSRAVEFFEEFRNGGPDIEIGSLGGYPFKQRRAARPQCRWKFRLLS